jgi:hypothetical protein
MVETLKLLPGPKKSWLATRELGPMRAMEGEPMYWRCADRWWATTIPGGWDPSVTGELVSPQRADIRSSQAMVLARKFQGIFWLGSGFRCGRKSRSERNLLS